MYGKDTIVALSIGANESGMDPINSEEVFILDATTDKFAMIFRLEKAMNFDEIALPITIRNLSPSYTVTIEGVSVTTGQPDATDVGSTAVTWVPAGTAPYIDWVTLAAAVTGARGDTFAVVIDYVSGTAPDGSNNVTFIGHANQFNHANPPYMMKDTGAGWTDVNNVRANVAVRVSGTDDDVQGNPILDPFDFSVSSSTSGDRLAQSFILPVAMGRRVKVHGVAGMMLTGADYKIGIWDAAGNVAITGTFDKDQNSGATTGDVVGMFAPVWLDTGKLYYAGFELASGGGSGLYHHDCAGSNDNLSAFHGYPNNNLFKFSSSAWAKQNGHIATNIVLLVSAWDAGRGHMRGGLNQ